MWKRRRFWDPFEFAAALRSEISRALDEALYPLGFARAGYFEPYVDVYETPTEVIVTAELPGIKKKDIRLNATEDTLEISAEAREEIMEERPGIIHKERRMGRFYRSLPLPCKVRPEEARAKYVDGILEVRLPKAETKRGHEVKID
jgi:HSP20 family protein